MDTDKQPAQEKETSTFHPVAPVSATTPSQMPMQVPAAGQLTVSPTMSVPALLSLVISVALFWLAPLSTVAGIVLGIIGISQTKNGKYTGRGLAVAGLIVSIFHIVLGVVFVIGLFFVAAADQKRYSSNPDLGTAGSYSSYNTPKGTTIQSNVGGVGVVGDVEVVVSAVDQVFVATDTYSQPSAGNKYVLIKIQLKNLGAGDVYFNQYNLKVKTLDGAEILYPGYVSDVTDMLTSFVLSPGEKKSGSVIYEINSQDTAAKLIYQPTYNSDILEVSL
jgi:Domain of unknown function (DUF4352)/Domain of unknown function (DUF4190)